MAKETWAMQKKRYRDMWKADGRWQMAMGRREHLKHAEGLDEKEAWLRVMEEYPPLTLPPKTEEWTDEQLNEVATIAMYEGGSAKPPKKGAVARPVVAAPAAAPVDLVTPDVFADKPDDTGPEDVRWVAAHCAVVGIKAEDAPSKLAWSLLRWVQQSPMNERDFWTNTYPKVLPSKSQLDREQEQREDDGSSTIRLAEELRRRNQMPALLPGAEGVG